MKLLLGLIKFRDGDKWVCTDEGVGPPSRGCLVYSFGINYEWSFDDAMAERGCKVCVVVVLVVAVVVLVVVVVVVVLAVVGELVVVVVAVVSAFYCYCCYHQGRQNPAFSL